MTKSSDHDVRPQGLRRFRSTLEDLAAVETVDEALQSVVDLATELIPGCAHADVMIVQGPSMFTPVATSAIAVAADRAQQETGQGPCLTAAGKRDIVIISNDLATDERWPEFSGHVQHHGIRSAVSYGLFSRSVDRQAAHGALNLYGAAPQAFSDRSVEIGELLAVQSAVLLEQAIESDGLRKALESRDLIGQAKGILMAERKIAATEAFEILKQHSQANNMKLRDLAAIVTETGTLP